MQYLIDDIQDHNNDFYKEYFIKYRENMKLSITNSLRKKQSILVRYLLEQLLKEKNSINNNFVYNENGKPYLKDNSIYFNFSHSYNKSIVAISKKEIGVDIEKIRITNINTIKKFATEKEKKFILQDKNLLYERLFLIYTLKESYCKMLGEDLKKVFEVEFVDNDCKNIVCSDKNVKIYYFFSNNYVYSICERIRNE